NVVVDLRFRGEYTPETRRFLQKHIAKNDLQGFREAMKEEANWPQVPRDRFKCRYELLEGKNPEKYSSKGQVNANNGNQQSNMTHQSVGMKSAVNISQLPNQTASQFTGSFQRNEARDSQGAQSTVNLNKNNLGIIPQFLTEVANRPGADPLFTEIVNT